jgi:lactoylglutathione lyase
LPPSVETFFPIIRVGDLGRSLAFYCDLLGLTAGYRWPAEGDPQFVVVAAGDASLGLAVGDNPYEPDDRFELCFYVASVDGTVGQLRAEGVPVLHEPEDMPWGERMAWVADPDGNRVHLTERSSATVAGS